MLTKHHFKPLYKGLRGYMKEDIQKIRDNILEAALPELSYNGWQWDLILRSTEQAGYTSDMAVAVFPSQLSDVLDHFSDWADRGMMASLSGINPQDHKIRERVAQAVFARLQFLQPHRGAVKGALAYWAVPLRGIQGGRVVWRTANRIWLWAGDTSTDYNRYTKRSLLTGVIGATTLAWLNDDSDDLAATHEFLMRRIENVMKLGQFIGKLKAAPRRGSKS
jgi:ubiquinone biosynthesis protein COQ9